MSGRGGGRGRGRGGRGYAPPTGGKMYLLRSAEECGLDTRNLRSSLQDMTHSMGLYPDILLPVPTFPGNTIHNSMSSVANSKTDSSSSQQRLTDSGLAGAIQREENSSSLPSTNASAAPRNVMSSNNAALILKAREIHHRMTHSPFFFRPTKDSDVVRYSSLKKMSNGANHPNHDPNEANSINTCDIDTKDVQNILRHCLEGQTSTEMGRYVPEELVLSSAALFLYHKRKEKQKNQSMLNKRSTGLLDDLEAKERSRRQRLGSIGSEALAGEDGNNPATGEEEEEGLNPEEEVEEEEEEEEQEDYVMNYYESEGDDYDDGSGGKGDDDGPIF